MSSKQVRLLAIHESRDAYVKEGDYCYLIRPPMFRYKHEVDETAVDRAKDRGEFVPPPEGYDTFEDLHSLRVYLSASLPKATGKTVRAALDFISRCRPEWRKRIFLQDDRGDPELISKLLVGISRLEALDTLTEDEMRQLNKWRSYLEDSQRRAQESPSLYPTTLDTRPQTDEVRSVPTEIESPHNIFKLSQEAGT